MLYYFTGVLDNHLKTWFYDVSFPSSWVCVKSSSREVLSCSCKRVIHCLHKLLKCNSPPSSIHIMQVASNEYLYCCLSVQDAVSVLPGLDGRTRSSRSLDLLPLLQRLPQVPHRQSARLRYRSHPVTFTLSHLSAASLCLWIQNGKQYTVMCIIYLFILYSKTILIQLQEDW